MINTEQQNKMNPIEALFLCYTISKLSNEITTDNILTLDELDSIVEPLLGKEKYESNVNVIQEYKRSHDKTLLQLNKLANGDDTVPSLSKLGWRIDKYALNNINLKKTGKNNALIIEPGNAKSTSFVLKNDVDSINDSNKNLNKTQIYEILLQKHKTYSYDTNNSIFIVFPSNEDDFIKFLITFGAKGDTEDGMLKAEKYPNRMHKIYVSNFKDTINNINDYIEKVNIYKSIDTSTDTSNNSDAEGNTQTLGDTLSDKSDTFGIKDEQLDTVAYDDLKNVINQIKPISEKYNISKKDLDMSFGKYDMMVENLTDFIINVANEYDIQIPLKNIDGDKKLIYPDFNSKEYNELIKTIQKQNSISDTDIQELNRINQVIDENKNIPIPEDVVKNYNNIKNIVSTYRKGSSLPPDLTERLISIKKKIQLYKQSHSQSEYIPDNLINEYNNINTEINEYKKNNIAPIPDNIKDQYNNIIKEIHKYDSVNNEREKNRLLATKEKSKLQNTDSIIELNSVNSIKTVLNNFINEHEDKSEDNDDIEYGENIQKYESEKNINDSDIIKSMFSAVKNIGSLYGIQFDSSDAITELTKKISDLFVNIASANGISNLNVIHSGKYYYPDTKSVKYNDLISKLKTDPNNSILLRKMKIIENGFEKLISNKNDSDMLDIINSNDGDYIKFDILSPLVDLDTFSALSVRILYTIISDDFKEKINNIFKNSELLMALNDTNSTSFTKIDFDTAYQFINLLSKYNNETINNIKKIIDDSIKNKHKYVKINDLHNIDEKILSLYDNEIGSTGITDWKQIKSDIHDKNIKSIINYYNANKNSNIITFPSEYTNIPDNVESTVEEKPSNKIRNIIKPSDKPKVQNKKKLSDLFAD